MRNKLLSFIRSQKLLQPGDRVICAVSGGADSMALLWAMYQLRDKLQICLEAAHFNHHLRDAESDRDEAFVVSFCQTHGIFCHVGGSRVVPGEKGLEAAARTARYAFLQTLPGKIATAHTADDNAETLLMHLIRGTGLKGLGGIAPCRENLIRPMLSITRQDVMEFLEKEHISYVTDSSNASDAFLRNRIRRHVMPLLKAENPSLSENLSAMALGLRQDAALLEAAAEPTPDVTALRQMPPALQTRALGQLLLQFGVKEPEAEHIQLLRRILYSENPSAAGEFPGAVVGREYDRLVKLQTEPELGIYPLCCPGITPIPELGIQVICQGPDGQGIPVCAKGELLLRSRRAGDAISLSCGTKRLKKLFIDAKIPALRRNRVPVIVDEAGVLLVGELNIQRTDHEIPNCTIRFESLENQQAL